MINSILVIGSNSFAGSNFCDYLLSKKFILSDFNMKNYPNDSISQGASYWENFLTSYKNKKTSYSTDQSLMLTTQIIEFYYAN